MPAAVNQDFTTFVGDVVTPKFLVTGNTSTAINISTTTGLVTDIQWSIQRASTDAVALTKTYLNGQITFTANAGSDGIFNVSIGSTDTIGLSGWYQHKATIFQGSSVPTTVTVGRMYVGPTDWSWNPGSVGIEPLYTVRQIIGDYNQSDQLQTDSQIRWALKTYSNEWLAGAECARNIAMNFARQVDVGEGPMKKNYSQRYKAYMQMSIQLQQLGMAKGGVTAYVGGTSIVDKTNQAMNTDRVPPNFVIAMHDNLLPEGPVGLQSNSNLQAPSEQSGDVFNAS